MPSTIKGTAIRKATADDEAAIVALVRAERLNPNGLVWSNFIVARSGGTIIGAAQIRRHGDGARELGSLVVAPPFRGQGLAAELVDALLAQERDAGALCIVTGQQNARHYTRWGFNPIPVRYAPKSVRRNYVLGQLIGGAHALLNRRPVNHLVVLSRISG